VVRRVVDLPVLRKDFLVTRRQLYESAVLGADAVLMISRILDREILAELLTTASELDLEVLLEIFADENPESAVASGAGIIGVNARDLATFETRLDRVEAMAKELPADRVLVAESGIHGPDDLDRLHAAGYDGCGRRIRRRRCGRSSGGRQVISDQSSVISGRRLESLPITDHWLLITFFGTG